MCVLFTSCTCGPCLGYCNVAFLQDGCLQEEPQEALRAWPLEELGEKRLGARPTTGSSFDWPCPLMCPGFCKCLLVPQRKPSTGMDMPALTFLGFFKTLAERTHTELVLSRLVILKAETLGISCLFQTPCYAKEGNGGQRGKVPCPNRTVGELGRWLESLIPASLELFPAL